MAALQLGGAASSFRASPDGVARLSALVAPWVGAALGAPRDAAAIPFFLPAAAPARRADFDPSVFVGRYTDPKHPGGTREVRAPSGPLMGAETVPEPEGRQSEQQSRDWLSLENGRRGDVRVVGNVVQGRGPRVDSS